MGCQKKIVNKIIKDKKADYVIALKGNQGILHGDIKLFFEGALKDNFDGIDFDFHKIGMVISERDTGDNISKEARYFICSIPKDAKFGYESIPGQII